MSSSNCKRQSGGVECGLQLNRGRVASTTGPTASGTEVQMQTQPTALERIIADNDPRNGSIVNRLIRMLEHPERQPDKDGLYRDELAPEGS